ncbi:D-alanyl-D-alanine dipeptidase [Polaromonas sp. OV174]|uniref:D-alanyl-D-alanine dipeptidase n=1 Tax=Polaromonas sp. OV174 TaxID=1855300 RepID=UPI0008E7F31E|nr:D-alanyl-D-alanine dipeptidase [Polaromonas sp. OV174]SFC15596.1 D-alanyl-D-alanine dipeptidase [Polaromonas sp. OV174]
MSTQSSLVLITEASHDVAIAMAYAGPDNFTGQVIYDNDLCYLHAEAEAGLRKAIAAARGFGFQLKILDAFRPQEAQEALWAVAPNPAYIANPAKGSNHTRGVAVDVTLIGPDGQVLDMGTPFDTMNKASHHFHAALPAQIQVNRAYLLTLMLEAGFVHHPNEWWHYQLPDATKFPLIGWPQAHGSEAASSQHSGDLQTA